MIQEIFTNKIIDKSIDINNNMQNKNMKKKKQERNCSPMINKNVLENISKDSQPLNKIILENFDLNNIKRTIDENMIYDNNIICMDDKISKKRKILNKNNNIKTKKRLSSNINMEIISHIKKIKCN